MIYDANNAIGAKVYDVDTREEIGNVLTVDTERSTIKVAPMPVRATPNGNDLVTKIIQYRAIHAIRGNELKVALFHCYGRNVV